MILKLFDLFYEATFYINKIFNLISRSCTYITRKRFEVSFLNKYQHHLDGIPSATVYQITSSFTVMLSVYKYFFNQTLFLVSIKIIFNEPGCFFYFFISVSYSQITEININRLRSRGHSVGRQNFPYKFFLSQLFDINFPVYENKRHKNLNANT